MNFFYLFKLSYLSDYFLMNHGNSMLPFESALIFYAGIVNSVFNYFPFSMKMLLFYFRNLI